MAQFIAETRKAIVAGLGAAAAIIGPALLSGKVTPAVIAAAAGAFVAAAVLVYLVPNAPPAAKA
jgi:hypothetical protein